MLTSLAFGNAYRAEGNYLTLIAMNFIIALGLISTPKLMRSLIDSGIENTAQSLGAGAVSVVAAMPARMTAVKALRAKFISDTKPKITNK